MPIETQFYNFQPPTPTLSPRSPRLVHHKCCWHLADKLWTFLRLCYLRFLTLSLLLYCGWCMTSGNKKNSMTTAALLVDFYYIILQFHALTAPCTM